MTRTRVVVWGVRYAIALVGLGVADAIAGFEAAVISGLAMVWAEVGGGTEA